MRKNKTQDRIIEVAGDLFLSRGYSATSIDEICRKAKITKGGFFHYFKSKDDLGSVVLGQFCESSSQTMHEAGCCVKAADPLLRVFAHLDCVEHFARKSSDFKGCLMASFVQELSCSHPAIQQMCRKGLRGWSEMLRKELILAQKMHAPDSKLDMRSLADHCVSVAEGAQILARATGKIKPIKESIGHLKKYLKLIFNHKQTNKEEGR